MISIRITKHAAEDLDQAFWFYENQEIGLGDYFSSSVRADIEGLRITGGIHRRVWEDYHRLICKVFPFITLSVRTRWQSGRSWIVDVTQSGSEGILMGEGCRLRYASERKLGAETTSFRVRL